MSDTDTQNGKLWIARNDDLIAAQQSLHSIRPPRERGMLASGWLGPEVCWALYKQFGVLRQLLTKVSNQAVSKGWRWTEDGIGYDWSAISSRLEEIGFQRALKTGIRWAHVEGGAGLVFRLDEVQLDKRATHPEAAPVVPENVRGLRSVEVYSATQLRPLAAGQGVLGYWDTADRFEIQDRFGRREIVHASRVVPLVVDDVPIGGRLASLYSTTTGWPPSWLDGVVDSLQDWRDSEATTSNLIHTISLLVLELEGARESMTSPDPAEQAAFGELVGQISNTLSSHGILALPHGDRLGEVSRQTGGVERLVKGKKETFVSDTGYSSQRVLMVPETGLGDTSKGPRLDDHETIEGLQEAMVTPAVNRATDFLLMAKRHEAVALGYPYDGPEKWVLVFRPLASQTPEEQAKSRETHSKARSNDVKAGVPAAAILSDPDLLSQYPRLGEILEADRIAEEEARAAAAEAGADPTQPPASEPLLSASKVAERLGVSPATILAMRSRGTIRGWKIGGRWRFAWSQVSAALSEEFAALSGVVGEVGDAARRARDALRSGQRVDAGLWRALEVRLVGARFDALPPGLDLFEGEEWAGQYGASEAMREIFALLDRVAPTDLPVLILGETGTGKEGIARGLHSEGLSAGGPFVAVNCSTLGDDAPEVAAALLGDGESPGLFEQADGGTLFLDEVGELEGEAQAVLLRALAGDVRRVEGEGRVAVRVVAATWRPVGMPGECDFRRDLFERLAGVVVELPPLRERGEDVLALADGFLGDVGEALGLSPPPAIGRDARAVLLAHAWPGNIRELRNAIRRAAVLAGAGVEIEPGHLQLHAGRVG